MFENKLNLTELDLSVIEWEWEEDLLPKKAASKPWKSKQQTPLSGKIALASPTVFLSTALSAALLGLSCCMLLLIWYSMPKPPETDQVNQMDLYATLYFVRWSSLLTELIPSLWLEMASKAYLTLPIDQLNAYAGMAYSAISMHPFALLFANAFRPLSNYIGGQAKLISTAVAVNVFYFYQCFRISVDYYLSKLQSKPYYFYFKKQLKLGLITLYRTFAWGDPCRNYLSDSMLLVRYRLCSWWSQK